MRLDQGQGGGPERGRPLWGCQGQAAWPRRQTQPAGALAPCNRRLELLGRLAGHLRHPGRRSGPPQPARTRWVAPGLLDGLASKCKPSGFKGGRAGLGRGGGAALEKASTFFACQKDVHTGRGVEEGDGSKKPETEQPRRRRASMVSGMQAGPPLPRFPCRTACTEGRVSAFCAT